MLIQFARSSFPAEFPPTRRVKIANWWTYTEKSELNWMSELNFIRTGMVEVVSTRKSADEPPPSFNIHQTISWETPRWMRRENIINHKAEGWKQNYRKENEVRKKTTRIFLCQILRTTFFRNQLYKFFLLLLLLPAWTANTILVGIESSLLINGGFYEAHT